jgi:putative transposase
MTQVTRDRLYSRHRFPAEVIAHAVWLYLRLPLSLRMIEDLLAARGIIVSHQTVRLRSGDFAGLRTLVEACKERFAYGIVLYDSNDLVPFSERLSAAPLSALWS